MSQGGIWWVYEKFLGLPVLVVLVTLWLVGGMLLVGLCALESYLLWGLLRGELRKRNSRARGRGGL
jgi:hypothetical protein